MGLWQILAILLQNLFAGLQKKNKRDICVKNTDLQTSCVCCFIVDQVTKNKDTRDKLIKATGELRWVKM